MEETLQKLLNGLKSMEFKMKLAVFIKQEDGLMDSSVLTLSLVVIVQKVKDVGLLQNMMFMKLKHGEEFKENPK